MSDRVGRGWVEAYSMPYLQGWGRALIQGERGRPKKENTAKLVSGCPTEHGMIVMG